MDVTKFKKHCIGIVSKDSVEFNSYIDVYPIELYPVKEAWVSDNKLTNEIADEEEATNIDVTDISGNIEKIKIIKHTNIKAKWFPEGDSNRLEAPNVYKNERVMLYRYGNTDLYYWTLFDNDFKYRKLEKRIITISNRTTTAEEVEDFDKVYEFGIDTLNKKVYLHTDDTDTEYTTYDMELDTLEGIFNFMDGKGNQMLLESQEDTLTINIKNILNINVDNDINITTTNTKLDSSDKIDITTSKTTLTSSDSIDITTSKTTLSSSDSIDISTSKTNVNLDKLSISNNTAELIKTISDLIQANIEEQHIGNLGIPTVLNSNSISVYTELKAKIDSFI